MRLALPLLLAIVLAGCSAPPAPTTDAPPEPIALAEDAPARLAPPPAAPIVPLAARIAIEEPWQRPLRELHATLDAPPGARAVWFAALDEAEPRAIASAGQVFVLKATTADHGHPAGTRAHRDELPVRARLDAGALPTDGTPATLRATTPGRYELAAGAARLVVNVWPDAPRDGAPQAFLASGAFSPAEIDVPLGAPFLLWNADAAATSVTEVGFAAYLAVSGANVSLMPVDEGLWRLQALLLDDAGGRGLASAPFLVDFEKPATRRELGPITGRFTQAAAGEPESTHYVFDARYEIARLDLALSAASSLPAPASVRVVLERDGEPVAELSTLEADAMRLEDLPPGDYAIRIVAEQGALVSFVVVGELSYRLPEPARLRDAR